MQDRVPKYPGRVTLTPVAGQANTYDLVRADQPTQTGTPLNAANLFSAETAAKYPSGTDTPDKAFKSLAKVEAVGDIKTTARTDLGENWLLCNGDEVYQAEYPELFPKLEERFLDSFWKEEVDVAPGYRKKVGQYWVRWPIYGSDIYYANSPLEQGTKISIGGFIKDMVFNGTYYVILGSDSTGWETCIYYSTSISGPYTYKFIRGNGSKAAACDNIIVDSAGRFVFCYYCYNSIYLVYGTNPSALSETSTSGSRDNMHIAYGNGYYILSGLINYTSNKKLLYTTDPTTSIGNWSEGLASGTFDFVNDQFVSTTGETCFKTPLEIQGKTASNNNGYIGTNYYNGFYFTFRVESYGSSSNYYLAVFFSRELPRYINDIDQFKKAAVFTIGSNTQQARSCFIYNNRVYVCGGNGNSEDYVYSNDKARYLPIISSQGEGLQGTYSYIKAKEGL